MKTRIFCSILLFSFAPVTWSVTTRLSVNAQGIEGYSDSFLQSSAALSADGRYAVLTSEASNLVPEDRNDTFDVFVYDIWLKQITRVSVDAQGREGNAASQTPALSANGRYVAFSSFADNLVPNDTNQVADIFIYDLQTHEITLVTQQSGQKSNEGFFHPNLSADGNYVAFDNSGLLNDTSYVFVYNRTTKEIQKASSQGSSSNPTLSADGRYVAFESVYEGRSHIFIYDLQTQQTRFLTQGAKGHSFAPSLSGEGQYVAFASETTNLGQDSVFDIFIQNLQTNDLITLHADDHAAFPSLSGPYLIFSSYATQFVPNDTNGTADVFRYELATQHLERINVDSQLLTQASISRSGCTVIFDSTATNLVEHDTNHSTDVFVQQMVTHPSTFDFATTILDIPTVQINEGDVYRAQLQLIHSSTFVLNHVEPIASLNTSCAYFSPESGLLYLPLVEANNVGQKTLYEVVMRIIAGADPIQFEMIRATPQ